MAAWNPVKDQNSVIFFSLSDAVKELEKINPNALFELRDGVLIIGSDYSGQHKDSPFEAYSFLTTTDRAFFGWLPELNEFKERHLPDGRRMSFKNLREAVRRRAYPGYLDVWGKLRCNLITVLVDCRLKSFVEGGAEMVGFLFGRENDSLYKSSKMEKMLKLSSVVALLIACLRDERQVSFWVSDHDEALDSDEKRDAIAKCCSFLSFGLTRWSGPADGFFCTTEFPSAPIWAEDVANIADLAAGVYCKIGNILPYRFPAGAPVAISSQDFAFDDRVIVFCRWLATEKKVLRHVLLRIQVDQDSEIRATAQSFLWNDS